MYFVHGNELMNESSHTNASMRWNQRNKREATIQIQIQIQIQTQIQNIERTNERSIETMMNLWTHIVTAAATNTARIAAKIKPSTARKTKSMVIKYFTPNSAEHFCYNNDDNDNDNGNNNSNSHTNKTAAKAKHQNLNGNGNWNRNDYGSEKKGGKQLQRSGMRIIFKVWLAGEYIWCVYNILKRALSLAIGWLERRR